MEGPCLESITDGNPEISAITGNRLISAMVLDRMDSEERNSGSSLKGCQKAPAASKNSVMASQKLAGPRFLRVLSRRSMGRIQRGELNYSSAS